MCGLWGAPAVAFGLWGATSCFWGGTISQQAALVGGVFDLSF